MIFNQHTTWSSISIIFSRHYWHREAVVITTAQNLLSKPEHTFCAGSNPLRGVLEIRDGEDLWQWFRLEIRLNTFHQSTIPQKQFIIIIYYINSQHVHISRKEILNSIQNLKIKNCYPDECCISEGNPNLWKMYSWFYNNFWEVSVIFVSQSIFKIFLKTSCFLMYVFAAPFDW